MTDRRDEASPAEGPFQTALRVVMMPRDANQYGSIFGGVILSHIDQAAFIEARRHGSHRWVTVAMDRIEFVAPVYVGDVVSFKTYTEREGRSSVQVCIRVEAERYTTGDVVTVTEAHATMVSVNATGRAIPFNSPPTVRATDITTPGAVSP